MTDNTSMVLVLILTKGHELVDTGKCTRILRQERCVIGRGSSADWILPDPANQLSRRHCVVEWNDGGYRVVDTSSNGTFVNDWDEPIPNGEACGLQDGDVIRVGNYYISAQMLPEDADARLKVDDFLTEPENPDPLANLLPKEFDMEDDDWVDDQIVTPEDELSEVLNDPLESPESILRKATETLDSYPASAGKEPIPPVSYGFEGYKYSSSVPFESESGISSEEGASAWDHNRTESDAFKLPRTHHQTIPEDWDVAPKKDIQNKARKPNDD